MNKVFSARMFLIDLRRQLKSLIIWIIAAALLILCAGWLFYTLEASGMPELMQEMMTSLPDELLDAVDLNIIPDFSDHTAVFGIMAQWVLVLMCIYACYIGAASLVKFSCDSSVNFLYAQPISRTALVITRFFSQFFSIIIYNIIVFIMLWYYGCTLDLSNAFSLSYMVSLVFVLTEFIFYSFGFLISPFMRTLSGAASLGFGTFIFTYAIALLSKLLPRLGAGVYICPYEYFSVYSMCVDYASTDGYVFPAMTAVFAVVIALAFFACGSIIFVQKDIRDH